MAHLSVTWEKKEMITQGICLDQCISKISLYNISKNKHKQKHMVSYVNSTFWEPHMICWCGEVKNMSHNYFVFSTWALQCTNYRIGIYSSLMTQIYHSPAHTIRYHSPARTITRRPTDCATWMKSTKSLSPSKLYFPSFCSCTFHATYLPRGKNRDLLNI